jgi:hypothetical protein
MIASLKKLKKKLCKKHKPDAAKNQSQNISFRSVRLFSTKSFKPLGTLVHHKTAVQALAFTTATHVRLLPTAQRRHRHHHQRHHSHDHHLQQKEDHGRQRHAGATDGGEADSRAGSEEDRADIGGGYEIDDDDEMTMAEKARRARWLVSGGKDGRVVVWELMDFSMGGSGTRGEQAKGSEVM